MKRSKTDVSMPAKDRAQSRSDGRIRSRADLESENARLRQALDRARDERVRADPTRGECTKPL